MTPRKIRSAWFFLVAALCSLAFVSATRGENHALLSTALQLRLLKKVGGGSSSGITSSNSNSGSSNNEGKGNSEIILDAYIDYAEAERKNNLRNNNQNNETRDSTEDSEDEGSGGLWPFAVAVFAVFLAAPCFYECFVRCRRLHKKRKESVLKRKFHDALKSLEDETFQQAAKPSRPAAAPMQAVAQLTTTSTTETSSSSEGTEIADPGPSWVAVFP